MSSDATFYRHGVRQTIATMGSIIGLLVVWAAAAMVADPRLLPGPHAVIRFVISEAASGELFFHFAMTLWRVAAAFLIAMAIGAAIGLWLGSNPLANRVFDFWLILLLNIPALVTIVLAYIWLGLTEAAAIGAVAANKLPNVVVTLREGARALNPAYGEVANVFRFSPAKRLRHVVLPQLYPYLAAASRSGIALIWKIVLVVELLGRSNGVGFQINLYFQLYNVTAILGYTVTFVAVMLAIELILVQPLERKANRWRQKPA